jgi:hypothetical protein
MRRPPALAQAFLLVPAMVALACATLTGCTAGGASGAAGRTTPPSSRAAASSPRPAGRIGPANPLLLTCAASRPGRR